MQTHANMIKNITRKIKIKKNIIKKKAFCYCIFSTIIIEKILLFLKKLLYSNIHLLYLIFVSSA